MMQPQDKLWDIYHDMFVHVDPVEQSNNTKIAREFMKLFCDFMKTEFNLDVDYITQGSAFENLQVHRALEFDFLLLIMKRQIGDNCFIKDRSPRTEHPILEDIKNMKKGIHVLQCYRPILLFTQDVDKQPAYEPMTEIWPFDSQEEHDYVCLSAVRAIDELNGYLFHFVQAFNEGKFSIPGVKKMGAPIQSNPSVKTRLVLPSGEKIDMDISPGIKADCGEGVCRYFVAKRKPALRDVHDERIKLLWLESFNQQEAKVIRSKKDFELRSLRILKSLFRQEVSNSYIWKTLFMWRSDQWPKSHFTFLTEILTTFVGCLRAEMVERRDTEICTGGMCMKVKEQKGDRLLKSDFSRGCENILARYENKKLEQWYTRFRNLSNILKNDKPHEFMRNVLPPEKLKLIREMRKEADTELIEGFAGQNESTPEEVVGASPMELSISPSYLNVKIKLTRSSQLPTRPAFDRGDSAPTYWEKKSKKRHSGNRKQKRCTIM